MNDEAQMLDETYSNDKGKHVNLKQPIVMKRMNITLTQHIAT